MSFDVSADAYLRFIGRYSEPLAASFAGLAGSARQWVLDVGCGPGALTAELLRRVGPESVSAVDPSASSPLRPATAARGRRPPVGRRAAPVPGRHSTPRWPSWRPLHDRPRAGPPRWPGSPAGRDDRGLRVGSRRRPRPADRVLVRGARPGSAAADESDLAGAREGDLARPFTQAGLADARAQADRPVRHASFDEWWQRFTLGVGPAGAYVAGVSPDRRPSSAPLPAPLPEGPVEITATAWAVSART